MHWVVYIIAKSHLLWHKPSYSWVGLTLLVRLMTLRFFHGHTETRSVHGSFLEFSGTRICCLSFLLPYFMARL